MTSKPTARERFEEIQRYSEPRKDYSEYDFLISLVEAAVQEAVQSDYDVSIDSREECNKKFWEEIEQRMAQGEGK